MTNAEYQKAVRSKRILLGKCVSGCGRMADTGDRCEPCAEENRKRNRDLYRRRHGIPLDWPLHKWFRPGTT